MMKKIVSFLFVFICVSIAFIGAAEASTTYYEDRFHIEFKSAYENIAGTEVLNILGDRKQEQELFPIDISGKYYGPIIPSSTFSLKANEIISFETSINIGPDVLISGASLYWVRIPIQGENIKHFSFSINEQPYMRVNNNNSDWVIYDDTGIFLLCDIPLEPRVSTFRIKDMTPTRGRAIRLIGTQEIYSLNPEQTIYVEWEGAKFQTNTGIHLAWAFVFLEGLPRAGVHYTTMEGNEERIQSFGMKHLSDINNPFDTSSVPVYALADWVDAGAASMLTKWVQGGWYVSVMDGPWSWSQTNYSFYDNIDLDSEHYIVRQALGWHRSPHTPTVLTYNHIHKRGIIENFGTSLSYFTLTMPFSGTSEFRIYLKLMNGVDEGNYNMIIWDTGEFSNGLFTTSPRLVKPSSGFNLSYELFIVPYQSIGLFCYSTVEMARALVGFGGQPGFNNMDDWYLGDEKPADVKIIKAPGWGDSNRVTFYIGRTQEHLLEWNQYIAYYYGIGMWRKGDDGKDYVYIYPNQFTTDDRFTGKFYELKRESYEASTAPIHDTYVTSERYWNHKYRANTTNRPFNAISSGRYIPKNIHVTVGRTDGIISRTKYVDDVLMYDMGYGTAFKYPGILELQISLNDGTTIYWKGRAEDVWYHQSESILGVYEMTYGLEEDPDRPDLWNFVHQHISERRKAINRGVVRTPFDKVFGGLSWINAITIEIIGFLRAFLEDVMTWAGWQLYGLVLALGGFFVLMTISMGIGFTEGGVSEVAKQVKQEQKFFKEIGPKIKQDAEARIVATKKKLAEPAEKIKRKFGGDDDV